MTDTALATAAVTLPVWTLQTLRVRALATAALTALDLARREAYWASEAGRARSASMWCGEQDAVSDQLDALRDSIAGEQATADALAAAITAAGYSPLTHANPATALECVLYEANIVRNAAQSNDDAMRAYGARLAASLRDYLAGKF